LCANSTTHGAIGAVWTATLELLGAVYDGGSTATELRPDEDDRIEKMDGVDLLFVRLSELETVVTDDQDIRFEPGAVDTGGDAGDSRASFSSGVGAGAYQSWSLHRSSRLEPPSSVDSCEDASTRALFPRQFTVFKKIGRIAKVSLTHRIRYYTL
jgi:hypothetical protein